MNKSKLSIILFSLFYLYFVIPAKAGISDMTLYSHYDYSEKTIHDDDDEIINDTSYRSNNYDLKFDNEINDQFSYQITAHEEDKDYTEQNNKDKQSQKTDLNLNYLSKNKLGMNFTKQIK